MFRVLLDWLALITILEFGLGGAVRPVMARAVAINPADVGAVITASVRQYLVVTGLMVIAGLVLVTFASQVIPVTPDIVVELRAAVFIGVAAFLVTPLLPFRVLLEAKQQGYIVNSVQLASGIATSLLAIAAAFADLGIPGQVGAVTLGVAGSAIGVWLITYRTTPPSDATSDSVRAASRSIRQINLPTFVRQITHRMSVQSDRMIVAAFLGPMAATVLYLTQRLPELVEAQLQSISSSTWVGLIELYHTGELDLFRKRFLELASLVTILGCSTLLPIVLLNPQFVESWVGENNYAGNTVTLLAAVNALVHAQITLWVWPVIAVGAVNRLVPLGVGAAIVNLALSVFLIRPLGVAGPLVGTLVGFGVIHGLGVPPILQQLFELRTRDVIINVFKPAIPAFIVVWIALGTGQSLPVSGLISTIMSMAAIGIAYLALVWTAILGSDERANVKGLLSRALGSGRG